MSEVCFNISKRNLSPIFSSYMNHVFQELPDGGEVVYVLIDLTRQ